MLPHPKRANLIASAQLWSRKFKKFIFASVTAVRITAKQFTFVQTGNAEFSEEQWPSERKQKKKIISRFCFRSLFIFSNFFLILFGAVVFFHHSCPFNLVLYLVFVILWTIFQFNLFFSAQK